MSKRLSPDEHASEQKLATIKKGNDGNKWIVIETLKVKRWLKLTGTVKKYWTHDNYNRPFYVVIADNTIIIYYDELQKCMNLGKYKNVFIGKNVKKYAYYTGSFIGSSILIELKKNHYIYICDSIKEFITLEPIDEFVSIMGNNDVMYPFANSKNFTYIMIDMVKCDRITEIIDPYKIYYGNNDIKFHKFKFKTIVPRKF